MKRVIYPFIITIILIALVVGLALYFGEDESSLNNSNVQQNSTLFIQGNSGKLYIDVKQTQVPVAKYRVAAIELLDVLGNTDEYNKMKEQNKIFFIDAGTKVTLLENKESLVKIVVLEGPNKDGVGYVPEQWFTMN